MNTLKYSLEYQCYPIWNYDPSGVLVENDSTCAVELRLRRQYSSHADTCLPLGSKIDPLI